MKHRFRSASQRSHHQPSASAPSEIRDRHVADAQAQTPPQPRRGNGCLVNLLMFFVLTGAASLVVGGAWISVQLILNPDAVVWLNRYLPEWTRIPIASQEALLTLDEIQAEVRRSGLIAGEPLYLETKPRGKTAVTTDLLIPMLKPRSLCATGDLSSVLDPTAAPGQCQQLVEIRVYQPASSRYRGYVDADTYFRLVSQMAIAGPEESFVIAPLVNAGVEAPGSTRSLPLSDLRRLENGQVPGIWLNLSGQRVRGDTKTAYGQIIHYNPERTHLSLMASWTSPASKAPYWQEITGKGMPELVVNQTVGLEPQFQVYQIKPRNFVPNPIQLEAISLTEQVFEHKAYKHGLTLARNGLWSPAGQWFQSLQKQLQNLNHQWPATAQAQMDLIRLHAEATQAQANQSWASPSQQVLTALIDGRWTKALQVFEASVQNRREIATLLKTDSGRLWNRIEAAANVHPDLPDIKAWGALMQTAQKDRNAAIAWLRKQPQNNATVTARVYAALNLWDAAFAVAQAPPVSRHPSRLIGSAEPLNQINPTDWLQPSQSDLQLTDQQTWYQVQVVRFHDGQQWFQAPFSNVKLASTQAAQQLWNRLGLNTDPQIQIIAWMPDGQQETLWATVKAARLEGNSLRLLAAGDRLSQSTTPPNATPERLPSPLAVTDSALQWLEPKAILLSELSQQQPQWVAKILPVLWRELQIDGDLPLGLAPKPEDMLQAMQDWSVQLVDVTGNNQPDVVFTPNSETLASLSPLVTVAHGTTKPKTQPRTLIFSDAGTLIYSEFGSTAPQSLMAIADLKDGGSATLVVSGPKSYTLQRWSAKAQRFE